MDCIFPGGLVESSVSSSESRVRDNATSFDDVPENAHIVCLRGPGLGLAPGFQCPVLGEMWEGCGVG